MSNLLIKGVKMPKTCNECQSTLGLFCNECPLFKDFPKEWTGESELLQHTRLSNCPLVEIPSHGDLIDRDELMDIIRRKLHDRAPSGTDVLLQLVFAPVVVEGEEEDAKKESKEPTINDYTTPLEPVKSIKPVKAKVVTWEEQKNERR